MGNPTVTSAAAESPPVAAVSAFVAAGGWSRPLVALSGGPDSVCLLLALLEVGGPLGLDLAACYVDHGLRPEGELSVERGFVARLCAERGVRLWVEAAARGAIEADAASSGGLEAAARSFRYAALERVRLGEGRDVVLTAHTLDDFLETMVMRFCTGSGAAGLRGIPELNGRIARPLLSVAKADVMDFLAERGQPYSIDSTNGSSDFLRNRVRSEVMPVLRSAFPHLASSLKTVARKMGDDEAALDSMASAAMGGQASVSAAAFLAAPRAVRLRIAYRLAGSLEAGRFPGGVAAEAADWDGESAILASGAGVEISAEGGRIRARRPRRMPEAGAEPEAEGFSILLSGPGSARIGMDRLIEVYSVEPDRAQSCVALSWPAWARSRRPGDAIKLAAGSSSLDELLREWKIAAAYRSSVAVIEDRDGVAAILAASLGGKDLFRRASPSDTQALYAFCMKGAVPPDVTRR